MAKDFATAGLTISAVGARTLAGATAFAHVHKVPHAHEGYDALCADPTVDIVYVSTPQNHHKRDALRALAAGKHVLVEKPFCMNAAEAEEVVAAATAAGLFCMEAMWSRFLPSYVAMKAVLESGSIGTPVSVLADHSQHLKSVPRLWDLALGGGALLDLGVYPVSFLCDVFGGAPTSVRATGTLCEQTGVDTNTAGVLGFPGGGLGAFTTSLITAGPISASISCTGGRIEVARSFYEQTSWKVFDTQGQMLEAYAEKCEGRGMQFEALHVEECVRGGALESPVMPLSQTVVVMRVLDAVRSHIGLVWPTA